MYLFFTGIKQLIIRSKNGCEGRDDVKVPSGRKRNRLEKLVLERDNRLPIVDNRM